MEQWFVYILKCSDDSLYTGISKEINLRLKAHNSGKGASYTRSRLPVELVYSEPANNHSAALIRESQIKRWSKIKKQNLIDYGRPGGEA